MRGPKKPKRLRVLQNQVNIQTETLPHGVIAGQGNYGQILTIAGNGIVNGNGYGVEAAFYGSIANAGHINATNDGVLLHDPNLNNSGSIHGGQTGVAMLDSGLINTGVISGGTIGLLDRYNLQPVNNYGVITGGTIGVYAAEYAVVTNFGSISGAEGGVFAEGRSFTNAAGAVISSSDIGLAQAGGGVQNAGLIISTAIAAGLYGSGSFNNSGTLSGGSSGFVVEGTVAGALLQNSGQISATSIGVLLDNGTVINSGTITGLGGNGIVVDAGTLTNENRIAGNTFGVTVSSGYLFNSGSGFISAGTDAVNQSTGSFVNDGLIASGNTGASFGFVNASNNGLLVGGNVGVEIAGGELYDSGTITGSEYAVEGLGAFNLGLNNTGVLNGKVTDTAGDGEIDLVGASGTLSGLGSSITGFNSILFDLSSGAGSWTLEGDIAGLAAGQAISGFAQGDTIVLSDFAGTNTSYISGVGLVLSNGAANETLALSGGFVTSEFIVTNDAGGVAITLGTVAPCFCAGTRIATAHGDVAVEELAIGDLVRTAARGLQPIRWIGRRGYEGRFIAGNHLALPVQIRAHALGENVPSRDLFVSPDHALAEGGVLVHAWRFINGVSITQAQSVERVEYFHIELDHHAVMFAENTPVESFLDAGCRGRFQNVASAPADLAPQEACLPRVEDGYYLARLKARIDARAGIFAPGVTGLLRGSIDEAGALLRGWAQDAAAPEVPVELELLCGGTVVQRFLANRYRADLRSAGLGSGCHAFELALPALDGSLSLRRVSDGAVLDQGWMAARRAG